MTLNDLQISAINEIIILNLGNLLEHPMYASTPDDMFFGMFQNLPSPFGSTINEWIGDVIMMSAIGYERQNNGEIQEKEFSPDRMVEITKTKRDQQFVDQLLEPLLQQTKANIKKKYHKLILIWQEVHLSSIDALLI